MTAHAKFHIGILLHNRNTNEDGLVIRMYQREERGETMYEVAVPVLLDTWAGRHYIFDWAESTLELSDNVVLKSSDNSPLLEQYKAVPGFGTDSIDTHLRPSTRDVYSQVACKLEAPQVVVVFRNSLN
jgi:hypothetical protein